MQLVDMAPFWWEVAAPAALAALTATAYVLAAWKWPALQTPVASWRIRRLRRTSIDPPWWWKPWLRPWFALQDWWYQERPVRQPRKTMSKP